MCSKGDPVVAFQGAPGAFSEEAARKLLGRAAGLPCKTFEDAFAAVADGAAAAALVPIENSLVGSIYRNYDLLVDHDLTITGEAILRVVHCLIAPPGVELAAIRRISSHPVALAQCEAFLRSLAGVEAVPDYDTAGSVQKLMASGARDAGAIAGASAAEIYGAQVLKAGVEDNPQNFTRFLLLQKTAAAPLPRAEAGGGHKTSIVFTAANKPGALFKALAAFVLRDIDLTRIESRPVAGRPWEYSFYLDLVGDPADEGVGRALAHLREMSERVRVLGCYPAAPLPSGATTTGSEMSN